MSSSFNSNRKIQGVFSALVTPFLNGRVDITSLEKLVNYQLENGIHGFVVNGTTAESPTLSADEVKQIYKTVQNVTKGKVPLILGTGTNSTAGTIANHDLSRELNPAAELVVIPYYNKPPQRGLIAHYQNVAATSPVPIILYNVPGRTITAMSFETVQALMNTANIQGIKEASGNIEFAKQLHTEIQNQKKTESFSLLSGDDGTFVDFMKAGGCGIISVMSNLIPAESCRWFHLCQDKQFEEAQSQLLSYMKLINGMYVEANPIPVKWMLWRKGIISSPEMRLPLVTLDSGLLAQTEQLMREKVLL